MGKTIFTSDQTPPSFTEIMEPGQIFVLIGVVLVLFFATLLLTSARYRGDPNKFLAASLITLSLLILRINGLLEHTILSELFEFLRIEYLFSVLLYMYVSAALKVHVRRSGHIILASPFVLFSGLHTFISVADGYEYDSWAALAEEVEPFEVYATILFNSVVVVLFTLKVQRSNSEASFKKWIYVISIGLMAIMASFLALEFLELLFDIHSWEYLGIGISLFFIGIAYLGVEQLQVQQELKTLKKLNKKKKSPTTTPKSKTALSHFERMQVLMKDDELFKNPNLDREALASMLGLSASSVTRILREEGQVSFNDFINQYRIRLAKNMLIDERFDIFSLEAIGKEVGFKSRSTFYETFKKEVGLSPGEFKKK